MEISVFIFFDKLSPFSFGRSSDNSRLQASSIESASSRSFWVQRTRDRGEESMFGKARERERGLHQRDQGASTDFFAFEFELSCA